MKNVEKILEGMTVEEMVGQVLAPSLTSDMDIDEVRRIVEKMRPGSIFLGGMTPDEIKAYTDLANRFTSVPVIVSTDVEEGTATPIKGGETLPCQMAIGAADDVDLTEQAERVTAQICRQSGIHWTFSPVVDLNINFRNAECNVRAFSDSPEHVIKIASAYLNGFQRDGVMACSVKHFPGQGADERNSHLTETENSLSKSKWMKTYGKVYRAMFKAGAASVMVGHSSLPAFETEKDETGYYPAVLSKSLITDLLKGKLKFKGVVISDAMCMVGVCSRVPADQIAVRFIQAGGDVVLCAKPEDYDYIFNAVKSGEIPIERLKDAVRRILLMKKNLHIFDDFFKKYEWINEPEKRLSELSQTIADKSIKIVRDYQNAIPAKLKKGDKILFINIIEPFFNKPPKGDEFKPLKDEFEKNGYVVGYYDNPEYTEIERIKEDYQMIMINCILSSRNHHGSTLRLGWSTAMIFWEGYALAHDNVVFTSFGDPYKIFDVPFMKTYINTFSHFPQSQIALAKVVMGQIEAQGKMPVEFKGFFDREV